MKPEEAPRPSRIVRIACGAAYLCDDDDKLIELPLHWTKRGLWARWLYSLGYEVSSNNIGVETVKPREGVTGSSLPKYCSRKKFLEYWESEYPDVVIGSKRTDMCDDCFVWSNNIRKLQKDVSGECDPEKLAKLGKDRQNIIAQCQQHFRHIDAQKGRIESAIEK